MKHKKTLLTVGIVAFILVWSVFLYFVSPREIVSTIGVTEGYGLVFLVASLGGVSTFTAASFYATVVTLASGGLNPFIVGLLGGVGVTIGDSIFFFLAKRGRDVVPQEYEEKIDRFKNWLHGKPRWLVPVATFIYAGLTPFPNDILTISLGLADTRYKYVLPALLIANIALTIAVAYLASQGATLFFEPAK